MLTHVWGLIAHPNREWKQIKEERETLTHLYEHHVLLLAAIPVVCSYIGTTQVGWSLGGGTTIQLGYLDALGAGVVFYLVILAAVYAVGKIIRYMAKRYTRPPSQSQCIVFAGYVATPMFLSGIVAVYPLIWLCLLAGVIGLCYTAYLLYLGIPSFLNISKEEGFIVSSTTLAFGVLILEALLGMTVLLWGYGERIILSIIG
ncbi:Yip1 family protein [Halomonas elongata]|uniref:Yip1 family protein n=1 Tax=Halomonas elongata (strain ATCC 33173 / DSM 2581 / NBRC 15536 / NCIMB 2198 / 1H9) TaxID=768066 RepID=E1V579_HALED|nr:Yip1 family protein [Halomonas elongata]MBW5799885.1 YIP1 family protein [Halomonas elongata]MDL4863179.1 Yip1 family protein [Halomonas elongata]RAW08020.1 YIP1 family protein [Halomonas elongata]WBF16774.1 YIP1 family protein [Halomonas elongata]WPU45605.1 Yip1 family protein [Halomonas elongata DSM 2581]